MLKKQKGRVTILEKSNEIGGLMKTFDFNGFLFDFAPHIFRSQDDKIMKLVKNLLYGNYHHISSNPAIFRYGKFFENVIPSITCRNIENLPKETKEKAMRETRNSSRRGNLSNFENCIVSQIGETLYWEFFGEYSKKWWGIDPKNLSSDLAPRNLKIGKEKSYAHITTYFEKPSEEIYPTKGGISKIVERLKEKIEILRGKIVTNSKVKGLEYDGNKITRIIVEKNGEETEIISDGKIISTIPLTSVCEMLEIENELTYRGDICIFLKLKGGRMLDFSWIYFHDSNVLFGRIHEPLYYSRFNAPNGYTSLCVEVSSFEKDKTWSDKNLGDRAVEQLIDLKIIKKSHQPEILGIAKYAHAYPIYTIDYKQELGRIFEKLNKVKNLKVIGRTGGFSYQNMWECLKWATY